MPLHACLPYTFTAYASARTDSSILSLLLSKSSAPMRLRRPDFATSKVAEKDSRPSFPAFRYDSSWMFNAFKPKVAGSQDSTRCFTLSPDALLRLMRLYTSHS